MITVDRCLIILSAVVFTWLAMEWERQTETEWGLISTSPPPLCRLCDLHPGPSHLEHKCNVYFDWIDKIIFTNCSGNNGSCSNVKYFPNMTFDLKGLKSVSIHLWVTVSKCSNFSAQEIRGSRLSVPLHMYIGWFYQYFSFDYKTSNVLGHGI